PATPSNQYTPVTIPANHLHEAFIWVLLLPRAYRPLRLILLGNSCYFSDEVLRATSHGSQSLIRVRCVPPRRARPDAVPGRRSEVQHPQFESLASSAGLRSRAR